MGTRKAAMSRQQISKRDLNTTRLMLHQRLASSHDTDYMRIGDGRILLSELLFPSIRQTSDKTALQ